LTLAVDQPPPQYLRIQEGHVSMTLLSAQEP